MIGRQPSSKRPGFTNKRTVIEVDRKLNQYYEDSEAALLNYRKATFVGETEQSMIEEILKRINQDN